MLVAHALVKLITFDYYNRVIYLMENSAAPRLEFKQISVPCIIITGKLTHNL